MTRGVSGKQAILLLAHGSPDAAEDIPEYLSRVTGGRGLPPQVVTEITHRYELIGSSPLTKWTMKQAEQLANKTHVPVYVGMRNWKPFIAETLKQMEKDGISHVVAICLAPQNSRTSVGLYRRAVEHAQPPFSIEFVESWHDHPLLVKAFSEKLLSGWQRAGNDSGSELPIIFTAHSVPARTIADGDPYQAQAHETAELVARQSGLNPDQWSFAFQSQGMSGGPWIGPTVEDTIIQLKQKGSSGVFIQPVGFLCDHVEVLYDIDMAFKNFAEQNGMRLSRAESLNDSAMLTAALADIARARLLSSLSPAESKA
ncbi:MAG TPA: ferrochelatase [Terriglobales bacterium]|nr:ferrochelatase [Terriglobales bacterium]